MSVAFSLPSPGRVRLEVFDVMGRQVGGAQEWEAAAGHHVVPVSAFARLAPGVHILELRFGDRKLRTRCVVIR
jgi:hypothetical protein